MPGKDRHSLPALIKIEAFSRLSEARDPKFIRDCGKVSSGSLVKDLRLFRIVDLAHNLPIDATVGFTVDRLRETLYASQKIVDRLVKILNLSEVSQVAIFQAKKETCEQFWRTVAPKILVPDE